MKREFSAGGIVFNLKGEVLLVQSAVRKYWGFPKGLIDPGQTSKEAAAREVQEEGGIEAEIKQKIGETKFIYTKDGEKVFKVVTYFLMDYISGDPKDHDWEISDVGWFKVEEALKKLTFKDDQELLKKALEVKNGQ